ncbi:Dak1 domain-containing protein [Obelidium mucronatum]|nr:Dak1 domain-containing protein [Obelidium mucronatum]
MPLFVESPSLVSDAIDGATLLDGHPGVRTDACSDIVVLRTLPASQTTAVLSGGGSGHEPAHAGFVGGGMLAGAVCGGVFAAPASAQAVRALSQLGRDAVLVAKNYTGDRLSFGRALERFAAVSGRAARLVVVADDCALPHARTAATGRRGLAGAVLVYKVAGEAARRGATVAAVAALAEEVARRVGTVGVAVRAASCGAGSGHPRRAGLCDRKALRRRRAGEAAGRHDCGARSLSDTRLESTPRATWSC